MDDANVSALTNDILLIDVSLASKNKGARLVDYVIFGTQKLLRQFSVKKLRYVSTCGIDK